MHRCSHQPKRPTMVGAVGARRCTRKPHRWTRLAGPDPGTWVALCCRLHPPPVVPGRATGGHGRSGGGCSVSMCCAVVHGLAVPARPLWTARTRISVDRPRLRASGHRRRAWRDACPCERCLGDAGDADTITLLAQSLPFPVETRQSGSGAVADCSVGNGERCPILLHHSWQRGWERQLAVGRVP